jgi:hypothetical protein
MAVASRRDSLIGSSTARDFSRILDTALTDEPNAFEGRMRAALHLPRTTSSPASGHHGRHRYVQDGEVPVVVINARSRNPEDNRAAVAELERALGVEREARRVAEDALHQAEDTIRQLQTRLAHAEIAQREAASPPPPAPAPPAPAPPAPAPPAPALVQAARDEAVPPEASRSKRSKPAPAEDEPVEWWKPGWQERVSRSR